jgi:hypothetical protein
VFTVSEDVLPVAFKVDGLVPLILGIEFCCNEIAELEFNDDVGGGGGVGRARDRDRGDGAIVVELLLLEFEELLLLRFCCLLLFKRS